MRSWRVGQAQETTIQAVKDWLQREHGWLLILDNADTPDLLPAFLPPTVGGHLLIITRAADLSAHIASLVHPLVVDTFSEEQGVLFLLHRSPRLKLPTCSIRQDSTCRIVRALAIFENILDRTHPFTQTVRANYASLLQAMGRNGETEQPEAEP